MKKHLSCQQVASIKKAVKIALKFQSTSLADNVPLK